MPNTLRRATHSVRDAVRTSLWPIPIFGVTLATVLGMLLPRLDLWLDDRFPGWLLALTFGGDAGAARTVLDAVASSLITVTSLTFSLTVVTLQLASSQFSPRLLRTFTQDLFVQATLAIFLATFTYSLTVLRSVRSQAESASPFVPRLAVTISFVLAVASVVALVLFLAHLTRQIRVETMLRNVHLDASSTISTNLNRRGDADPDPFETSVPPPGSAIVWAPSSGFLIRVDHDELLNAANEADLIVRIERYPGSFVVAATPLGWAWGTGPDRPDSNTLQHLQNKVDRVVHLGPERTAAQDVGYGLRQLTDVANKALSPGINDPTTAIHALGHTSALLAELTHYELGPSFCATSTGRPVPSSTAPTSATTSTSP